MYVWQIVTHTTPYVQLPVISVLWGVGIGPGVLTKKTSFFSVSQKNLELPVEDNLSPIFFKYSSHLDWRLVGPLGRWSQNVPPSQLAPGLLGPTIWGEGVDKKQYQEDLCLA